MAAVHLKLSWISHATGQLVVRILPVIGNSVNSEDEVERLDEI
jgi:hypothetical protein